MDHLPPGRAAAISTTTALSSTDTQPELQITVHTIARALLAPSHLTAREQIAYGANHFNDTGKGLLKTIGGWFDNVEVVKITLKAYERKIKEKEQQLEKVFLAINDGIFSTDKPEILGNFLVARVGNILYPGDVRLVHVRSEGDDSVVIKFSEEILTVPIELEEMKNKVVTLIQAIRGKDTSSYSRLELMDEPTEPGPALSMQYGENFNGTASATGLIIRNDPYPGNTFSENSLEMSLDELVINGEERVVTTSHVSLNIWEQNLSDKKEESVGPSDTRGNVPGITVNSSGAHLPEEVLTSWRGRSSGAEKERTGLYSPSPERTRSRSLEERKRIINHAYHVLKESKDPAKPITEDEIKSENKSGSGEESASGKAQVLFNPARLEGSSKRKRSATSNQLNVEINRVKPSSGENFALVTGSGLEKPEDIKKGREPETGFNQSESKDGVIPGVSVTVADQSDESSLTHPVSKISDSRGSPSRSSRDKSTSRPPRDKSTSRPSRDKSPSVSPRDRSARMALIMDASDVKGDEIHHST